MGILIILFSTSVLYVYLFPVYNEMLFAILKTDVQLSTNS